MLKKIALLMLTINMFACSTAPIKIPKIENIRTFDAAAVDIKTLLLKNLPQFIESTSSSDAKISVQLAADFTSESKNEELLIKISGYKPKNASNAVCTIANNGGWGNKWNGLDYGIIYIFLIPPGREQDYQNAPTKVKIFSSFHENYREQAPGEVAGYVGGYAVQEAEWIDKGSTCFSTGVIESSIFNLIQNNIIKK